MSIQSHINRISNAKSLIKSAVANKDVVIPADVKIENYAEYISQIESKHADTVDGYHVRVIYNSSEPPADVLTNEVCFFCNGG